MIREFGVGVRMLFQGFGVWRTRPGLMVLGLIPAVIAFVLLAAALIPLAFSLGGLAGWVTPFADGWGSPWKELLRGAISVVVFIAALALAGAVFTALALTIGDPFYQRIWRTIERDLGGELPPTESGFWSTVGEGLRLIALGAVVAVVVLLLGFIPLVGGAVGAVMGVVLGGRLLARELTGRAFDARNLNSRDRARLYAGSRARVLGFGVATQLCFLVPLGAIVTMPAAVAGSTMLARSLVERASISPPPPPQDGFRADA